ncbi:MAG: DUF790 family protein [Victivallales bacterium]|nr:DUF790 family protein [Victivallales bacterium]
MNGEPATAGGSIVLTKDLINARLSGDRVQPAFISVADDSLLSLAARMIGIYNAGNGITRGEIDEMMAPIVSSCRNLRLGNGLRKTLEDRAEYVSAAQEDLAARRREVFLASARELRSGAHGDEASYGEAVRRAAPLPEDGLYSDLPENEKLVSIGDMTPRQLLERYNCALVQGLLLYSRQLELELPDVRPSQLRRLMRALRFNRLVADVVAKDKSAKDGDEPMTVKMLVDGPGSVLSNARSYGLQLALFFPHVCLLPKWRMKAKVELRGRWRNLVLDESCALVFNGRMTGAYVPEEVELFSKRIVEKLQGTQWHLVDECPYIKCKGGMFIVPDYAFMNDSGEYCYLELFHRWHATQISARLEALDNGAQWPLIIGVDNSIAQRPELGEQLASSAYFQQYGFTYRDYPLPDKVAKLLLQH